LRLDGGGREAKAVKYAVEQGYSMRWFEDATRASNLQAILSTDRAFSRRFQAHDSLQEKTEGTERLFFPIV
jgi:hypothetical protein